MKACELKMAVIYHCDCGKTNRGLISVYKGQEARAAFIRQFVFQPVDELMQASGAVQQAVGRDFAAVEAFKRGATVGRFMKLSNDVLDALPPNQAQEVRQDAIANANLEMEPDWEKIRVLVTPLVVCVCDILLPMLKVGATKQVFTCRSPECDQHNDWEERPDNPATCSHCEQQFHLDYTLLWPGGINGEAVGVRFPGEGMVPGTQGLG